MVIQFVLPRSFFYFEIRGIQKETFRMKSGVMRVRGSILRKYFSQIQKHAKNIGNRLQKF